MQGGDRAGGIKLPPRVFRSNLSNQAVRWSPFDGTKLALAQAQNFGMVGSGAISFLNVDQAGITCLKQLQTPDTTFDICFNEGNPNQLLSAGGDGNIRLWDLQSPQPMPLSVTKAHQAEVNGVEWSHLNKRTILTTSTDMQVKVWDATTMTNTNVFTHEFTSYQAIWHTTHESIFGSCSGDQTVRIWDLRSNNAVKRIHAHTNEVLSMDFNKYENFVATCSTDNTIKVWDLRSTTESPIMMLTAHTLPVKRVKFSPYHANILASASYDMSTLIWDCNKQQVCNRFDNHSEFVVGLDFNMFEEGKLASCSWDKSVAVFNIADDPRQLVGQ